MAFTVSPTQIKFPVLSLRRIPSPADPQKIRSYIAVVSAFDMPDLTGWRRINVRDPKLTGAVPKAIRATLDENPAMFFFMNRGLVLTASQVTFDTESSLLTLTLEDPEVHGLLDGGHTYKVIKDYCSTTKKETLEPGDQPFARLEILEGFGAEHIRDVVEARNTSNQVKDQSLMELEKAFDGIKKAVADQPYANMIAYKEYEILQGEGADGKTAKPIDIREVIALLTTFNKDQYGDNNHPIMAYSQKAACLTRFRDNRESYKKVYPLTKDILRIWDIIHRDMRKWYESGKAKQGQGAKFGRITGITPHKPCDLYYLGETADDSIPSSFKYPIIGALRALVEKTDGHYCWGIDPEQSLSDGLGEQLTEVVISNAMELRNPNKLGKTASVWDQCYSKAQVWYLKAQAASRRR